MKKLYSINTLQFSKEMILVSAVMAAISVLCLLF
jgi:hypothetical protein